MIQFALFLACSLAGGQIKTEPMVRLSSSCTLQIVSLDYWIGGGWYPDGRPQPSAKFPESPSNKIQLSYRINAQFPPVSAQPTTWLIAVGPRSSKTVSVDPQNFYTPYKGYVLNRRTLHLSEGAPRRSDFEVGMAYDRYDEIACDVQSTRVRPLNHPRFASGFTWSLIHGLKFQQRNRRPGDPAFAKGPCTTVSWWTAAGSAIPNWQVMDYAFAGDARLSPFDGKMEYTNGRTIMSTTFPTDARRLTRLVFNVRPVHKGFFRNIALAPNSK